MESGYKVIFCGKLRAGVDREQFVRAFAQMFKVSEEQARKLLSAGRPVALKDNLDRVTAEKYRAVMEKLGMEVRLEQKDGLRLVADDVAPAAPRPEQAGLPAEPTPVPVAPAGARCPKCGSERVQGDDCLACGVIISRYLEREARLAAEGGGQQNPYAAPQSDVTPVHEAEAGEMTGPHAVPAGNGWQWIAGGWRHIQRNPFAWIGALLIWYVMIVAVNIIPFIGPLALNLVTPVILAGLMLGANEQREGGDFRVGHLFAGFSANGGKLMQVGLFYLLALALVGIVAAVIIGGAAGLEGLAHAHGAHADPRMTGRTLFTLLAILLFTIPLGMAYWFAPALVVFEDIGPLDAMKLSFAACMKNMMPFLTYGAIAFVLAVIAMLPVGLGMLILAPVLLAAMYVSYRDIFYQPAEAQSTTDA